MLIDGQLTDLVPADDRGLNYGDGLFETIKVVNAKPQLWERHFQRLLHGCSVIGLQCPEEALLQTELSRVCAGNDYGVLKIVLTRGSGGRGYRPDDKASSRRIISFHELPAYPDSYSDTGIQLYHCSTPVSVNEHLAGLKTLCRLEQVLAQSEWNPDEFAEGLMLDHQRRVVEGTRTNIFMVHKNTLLTPSLESAGIKGVMRELIIELAHANDIKVIQRQIDLRELIEADEIFVCNSIIGIWPVSDYQGLKYSKREISNQIKTFLQQYFSHYE